MIITGSLMSCHCRADGMHVASWPSKSLDSNFPNINDTEKILMSKTCNFKTMAVRLPQHRGANICLKAEQWT